MGVRSSCEASATNWRRCCSVSFSRASEATAGRERRLDPLEHDVERPGQPADLGGLVGAGHPLVEVARGDGLGRGLDVLERAQAEADQPPAAGQREHERTGGHGELGQEERVQRARLVGDRLRLHEDVAVEAPAGDLGGPHPEGGTAGCDRTRREVGDLRCRRAGS